MFLAKTAISRAPVLGIRYFRNTLVPYKARTSYNSGDSTIDTDDILSENNPWSPTLFEDPVSIKKGFRNVNLPKNFRLSYQPLYESPAGKYVGVLKRLTLSFAILGTYGAKLFFDLPHFDDVYAGALLVASFMPALGVQFKTKDYVTRIFRVYDKDKPQTLENLRSEEQLVMEKLRWSGGKTYNELLPITGNNSLKLVNTNGKERLWLPYRTWTDRDAETGKQRYFYVADNIGGLKMDRMWGIVEQHSGVNNGRYIEDEK